MVLEFVSGFSSRSYPPVRRRTDYCGMNMITNMALKTRTRCSSFDQSVRKCNDRLVVNMRDKIAFYFRTVESTVLLLLCVKHHAHRNSKSRVYSGPPTRSYTAAAAGVAVRCCGCYGLGTRTHTRTVPLTSGWRVYIPRRGTHQQASQQAGPVIYRRLAVTERRLCETQLATYYYGRDSPRYQQGVGPPSTASVV